MDGGGKDVLGISGEPRAGAAGMYNGHREGALVAERLHPEIRNPVVRTTFPFLLVLSTHCALHTW